MHCASRRIAKHDLTRPHTEVIHDSVANEPHPVRSPVVHNLLEGLSFEDHAATIQEIAHHGTAVLNVLFPLLSRKSLDHAVFVFAFISVFLGTLSGLFGGPGSSAHPRILPREVYLQLP